MSTRREFLTQAAAAAGVLTATASQLARATSQDSAATLLKTYQVPNTDLTVTRLSFGVAMLGMDWKDPDFVAKTVPVINTALEQGINFLDTADIYGYGKAELAIGEVLKKTPGLRRKLVIQTKCGDKISEGGIVDNSRDHILTSVDGSLKRLGTDAIDILLLHWPDTLVEPEGVAEAFDKLKRSGKVRYFGVSNHSPYQIEILKKYVRQPLVANQIQLGLAYWTPPQDLFKTRYTHGSEGVATVDYCRANNIQVQAYSPLRTANIGKRPNLLNPADDAAPEVKKVAQLLADLAGKYSTKPAAIMLAWLLRHPAGIVPVIGATKSEHIVENCAADRIELDHKEWYQLLNAASAIQLSRS